MEPSLDHWTIIFLLAAAHGLFLSVVLFFHRKGNRRANRLLAGIMLMFGISLGYYVAFWTQYVQLLPRFTAVIVILPLLFGPLLLLYFRQILGKPFRKQDRWHFLPFTLFCLVNLPTYLSWNEASWFQTSPLAFFTASPLRMICLVLFNVHVTVYSIYLFVFLRRQTRRVSSADHQPDLPKIEWLRKSAIGFAGFTMSLVSYYVLVHTIDFNIMYDYAISLSMTLGIYAVGYVGYRYPEVLSGYPAQESTMKYARSNLTEEEATAYLQQILQYIEEEKPYLDCELRMETLAADLQMSKHHFSQVINEKLHLNFSDFMNSYRIREAQRLLEDPANQASKIMAIAYDAGFNTKASFYNAFKKQTGISPARYRTHYQNMQQNVE